MRLTDGVFCARSSFINFPKIRQGLSNKAIILTSNAKSIGSLRGHEGKIFKFSTVPCVHIQTNLDISLLNLRFLGKKIIFPAEKSYFLAEKIKKLAEILL